MLREVREAIEIGRIGAKALNMEEGTYLLSQFENMDIDIDMERGD